jgi:AcrR family transcriptional regulator
MPETVQPPQPDTKLRLLDAAERLFASEGFHGVSLRQLTTAAQANLAAVNYHFGSKEGLLVAVFERRLLPLNELRSRNLQRLRHAGARPAAREVLRAFIEPTLAFRDGDPGAEAFVRLVGRAIAEPDDTIRTIFMRLMGPVFLLLFETLAEALPQLPRSILFWRLHFMLGAMSHTMCLAGRFQIIPPGVSPDADGASLTLQILDFLTAGMEASCG